MSIEPPWVTQNDGGFYRFEVFSMKQQTRVGLIWRCGRARNAARTISIKD